MKKLTLKPNLLQKISLTGLVLAATAASAAQPPAGMFTQSEIRTHQQQISRIVNTASDCLDATYADHIRFFDKHGVSKYYGERHSLYKTRQGRIDALVKYTGSSSLIDQLEPTSCIGLAMKCLKRGFEEVGTGSTWSKMARHLGANGTLGTDLQIMLSQLGWKLYYWNPDPSQNSVWDQQDKDLTPLAPRANGSMPTRMPVWGAHTAHYNQVKGRGYYFTGMKIFDSESLVGFGVQPPMQFGDVPFFVGIAHAGYHVFPGRHGDIIEAHSTRNLNSRNNLEFAAFNPLAQAYGEGGAPQWTNSEIYRSGVIAIPPGYEFTSNNRLVLPNKPVVRPIVNGSRPSTPPPTAVEPSPSRPQRPEQPPRKKKCKGLKQIFNANKYNCVI